MSQLPDQIEEATAVSNRIRAALGCGEITEPHTPENVSRARLLRVRAGLCHVLTEIMPGITASAERDELYAWLTGIAAALAAPLIGLAGADGFGIHFYEQSSAGKTTTANVASSLYGNPDLLRLTWYGTALGLANEAAAHNDGLMPLDEVGQGADPVSVSQSAYALFNGVGKLQGAKEGGNRDLKRWRTVAISTGGNGLRNLHRHRRTQDQSRATGAPAEYPAQ